MGRDGPCVCAPEDVADTLASIRASPAKLQMSLCGSWRNRTAATAAAVGGPRQILRLHHDVIAEGIYGVVTFILR